MNAPNTFYYFLITAIAVLVSAAIIYKPAFLYQDNTQETTAPKEVVQEFYDGYISYDGNPLVDHAYHNSPYLSRDFISRLDQFTVGEMQYDPVLCAQDVPQSFTPGDVEMEGSRVMIPVTTSFEGHQFVVELHQIEGVWMIDSVKCSQ
jgi:hypothetical protein